MSSGPQYVNRSSDRRWSDSDSLNPLKPWITTRTFNLYKDRPDLLSDSDQSGPSVLSLTQESLGFYTNSVTTHYYVENQAQYTTDDLSRVASVIKIISI